METIDKTSYISIVSLRDKVTSQLIRLLTLTLWILFLVFVWRAGTMGIQPTLWIGAGLVAVMSVLYIRRKAVKPATAASVVLLVLYSLLISGEVIYGPLSAAFILAPFISFYLSLAGQKRIAAWSIVVNTLILSVVGYLFIRGILHMPGSTAAYVQSPIPWAIIVTAVVGVSISFVVPFAVVPEALMESEERFRLAFENANVGVCLTGLDGRFMKVNRALSSMLGYSSEELERLSVSNVTYPDDIGQSMGFIKNAPIGGSPNIDIRKRYINRSGGVIWANVSSSLIVDSARKPQYFITYIQNITERKEAEDAMKTSEEKFHKIFHASPAPMSISTIADGKYIDVNETFLRYMEFKRDEVIGMSALDLRTWADEDERKQAMSILREHGSLRNFEAKYRTKYGTIGTSIVSAEIIELDGRDCLLGVTLDITERKEAEEALRKSEERFQKIFHASPGRISISTLAEGKFIDVNESFLRYMEYERSEVIGKTVYELNIWVDAKRREQMTRQVRENRSVREFEVRYKTKSGKIGYSLASAEIIELDGVDCMLTAVADITDRKLAEDALRISLEQLHTLAARMENIREEERKSVSRDVHDQLGQLLTALHMDLMSLRKLTVGEPGALDAKIEGMLDLTSAATRAVQEISARLRPGMLDDLGLVAAVEWQTEDFRKRSGIKCVSDLPEHDVDIDNLRATALFRILQETFTNVARHSKAKQVDVSLSESSDEIVLSVRDDGIGISQSDIDNPRSYGLLGIRERLRPFGGSCLIQSAETGGTEVLVRLRRRTSSEVQQ